MTIELFKDNYEANCAYKILTETNRSVFLTGKAGTGKSTFIELADSISKTLYFKLAPTGVAAVNINGDTIHSVLHFPPSLIFADDDSFFDLQKFWPGDRELICHADLIIIDEISMVSSAFLDCVDRTIKKICGSDEPFAGKKMLFVGDPFQLPPVLNREDRKLVLQKYRSEYFFDSKAWKQLNPTKIELQKIYRQNDKSFYNILNNVRENINPYTTIEKLNESCYRPEEKTESRQLVNAITLAFRKDQANLINLREIGKLPGEVIKFEAKVSGKFIRNACLAESLLELKIGARVMAISNCKEKGYVNGTLGIVKEISDATIAVLTDDGILIEVQKKVWSTQKAVIRNGKTSYETVGSLIQFPLMLAWAVTVHKSQGLTFDNVYLMNSSDAFDYGQTYVALSRCRSLKGIRFNKLLTTRDIQVSKRIVSFNENSRHDAELEQILEGSSDFELLYELEDIFDMEAVKMAVINIGFCSQGWSVKGWFERMLSSNFIEKIGDYFYCNKELLRIECIPPREVLN